MIFSIALMLPLFLFGVNILTFAKTIILFFVICYYVIKNDYKIYYDYSALFLFCFLFSYFSFLVFNINFNSNNFYSYIELLSIFFLYFSYILGLNLKIKKDNFLKLIYITILSLSIVPLISISIFLFNSGFEEGGRSIPYFYNKDIDVAATVMGGFILLSCTFYSQIFFKNINKFYLFIYLAVVLLCTIRLGSRTLILVTLISIIIGYLYHFKITLKNLVTPFFLLFLGYYLFLMNKDKLLLYFSDRIGHNEAGVASAGGRSEKWLSAFNMIFEKPLGWDLSLFGYAHNIFLDVARSGGVLSMLLLLLWFLSSTFYFIYDLKKLKIKKIKALLLSIFIVFLVSSMLEPIMDGFIYFFAAYLFILGLFRRYSLT